MADNSNKEVDKVLGEVKAIGRTARIGRALDKAVAYALYLSINILAALEVKVRISAGTDKEKEAVAFAVVAIIVLFLRKLGFYR